jgi:hypothetical protein
MSKKGRFSKKIEEKLKEYFEKVNGKPDTKQCNSQLPSDSGRAQKD